MPYVLSVIDNWDRHEGKGMDHDPYATAEEVFAAARAVIDESLKASWKWVCSQPGQPTAKALYSYWSGFGDNIYIFVTDGAPPVEPGFMPYDYARRRAEEIAQTTALQ
jgi:hypothetical protein